jgi:murein DD-endopeptidase MepM/ murein hydrolase activator NlpD
VDLSARCGTPIVAIGDGIVSAVDNLAHGSAPHNLLIDHPNGYASFYGHLLEKPDLIPGQAVKRGQVIAKSGDPDRTCTSRPHLHLEIRNAVPDRGADKYTRAYNPLALIDADWETLALTGASPQTFERDLNAPRRWQRLLDQPETAFWGPILNDYAQPWPDWKP